MLLEVTFVTCILMLSIYPDDKPPDLFKTLGDRLLGGRPKDVMKRTVAYLSHLINPEDHGMQRKKGCV